MTSCGLRRQPDIQSVVAESTSSEDLVVSQDLRSLVEDVSKASTLGDGNESLRYLLGKAESLQRIRQRLVDAPHPNSAKDAFRHHDGFQALLHLLGSVSQYASEKLADESVEDLLNLLRATLRVLSESINGHQGNRRYFTKRVEDGGWVALNRTIELMGDSRCLRDGRQKQRHMDRFLGILYAFALADDAVDDLFVSLRNYVDLECAGSSTGKSVTHSSQGEKTLSVIQGKLQEMLGPKAHWQNPGIVPAIVSILLKQRRRTGSQQRTHETEVLPAVAAFYHLATSSHDSLARVHSTGILSMVLPELLEASTTSSVSTLLWGLADALVALGLNSLDDAYFLYRRASTSPEIARFLLKALRSSQRPTYVHFDLSLYGYASVELSDLGHTFPPSSPSAGYTISIWVRFEEFDSNLHTTIFGAFDISQTCFVLVYLEKDTQNLILQTSITSSRPSVRFKAMNFERGQWYHICIAHRRPRKTSSSKASLFINGEFVELVKSQYPSDPLPSSTTGKNLSPIAASSNASRQVQAFFGTPQDLALRLGRGVVSTRWSLASAQVFSELLSDDLIAVHYQLGPQYNGNFQDCLGSFLTYKASAALNLRNENLHPGNVDRSDIVLAIRHKASGLLPESHIILNISVATVFGDKDQYRTDESYLLNLMSKSARRGLKQLIRLGGNTVISNGAVPAVNEALLRPHGVAVLTGAPFVIKPQSLDAASWSIGGCAAVGLKLVELATTCEALVRSVDILFESIRGSWRNSEAMERENGFSILAALLRSKTGAGQSNRNNDLGIVPGLTSTDEEREKLLYELLNLILVFLGYDQTCPENSAINNPLAYRTLLVDLDIWRQATTSVQQLYYNQFITFGVECKNHKFNAKRLSRMHIVKKMLDPLKGETYSRSVFHSFMRAFRSVVNCNLSAETLRLLSLFVTYAIQKSRRSSNITCRNTSVRTRQQTIHRLQRLSVSSSSSSLRSEPVDLKDNLSRADVGIHILEMYKDILCGDKATTNIQKFARTVTNKWLLYLLAEDDSRVVVLGAAILARILVVHGLTYVKKFAEKTGGFIIMRHHLKRWWKVPAIWLACFAILFGQDVAVIDFERPFTLFTLLDSFKMDGVLKVDYPEALPIITSMLRTGFKTIINGQQDLNSPLRNERSGNTSSDDTLPSSKPGHNRARSASSNTEGISTNDTQPSERPSGEYIDNLHTVCRFLAEVHSQSQSFRDVAVSSSYVQELLFSLYPAIVSSDVLTPDIELNSRKSALTFGGNDVVIRPWARAAAQMPPIVRTTTVEPPPTPLNPRMPPIRRGSSFVLVTSDQPQYSPSQARLKATMSPRMNSHSVPTISNSLVESLLELIIAVFSDQLLERKDFPGFGLFLKVPPGFQEHQAFYETYVLRNALPQLGNTIQLDQKLLWEPRILTNIARMVTHLGEALYEGWFLDGVEAVLSFGGTILEYLQRPDVAKLKSVRLCSQAVQAIRTVVLRVVLLRLSELDDASSEKEITTFMDRLCYWQTVLLTPEETQAEFLRLICYHLYTKLISTHAQVRLTAVSLWRIILMQKPEESSRILSQGSTQDQKQLFTGFKKLTGVDNEAFISWIDDHRPELDAFFFGAMSPIWERFVAEENRRTEETAKARVAKRRERLQYWLNDNIANEDTIRRHEVAADHWMTNIYASEHAKYQRAMQDQQDNSTYISSIFAKLNRGLQRPHGLFDGHKTPRWRLDQTEGRNRMRLRILPDYNTQQPNYQPKRKQSEAAFKRRPTLDTQDQPLPSLDAISTPIPAETVGLGNQQSDSSLSSVPSGRFVEPKELDEDFELVDDPREATQEFEDKNRKVMRTLQRGDQVEHVNNVSRIVGLEACEGLLILGKGFLYLLDSFFQRSDGEIVNVWQAPSEERDPYLQMISGRKSADFNKQQVQNSEQRTRSWRWEDVINISKRRFLFRDVAIELFFTDGRSYLLTTNSPSLRNELYLKLITKAPHVSGVAALAHPEDLWRLEALRSVEDIPQTFGSKFTNVFNQGSLNPATKKWIRGEMSNFHYLMLINTMAGRTFNDLTQYPIFPWVLADYTSEELDLDNPRSFRDLSKPMGCQTASRQAEFRDRYQSFAEMGDQNSPPFHYGTHYSSAMIVTSYLIRLQPFVQSYLLLQGGSFDHPDRLFYSIEKAWMSASRDNMTDVRELTPEFFYLSEFLTNMNGYNFGLRQMTGDPIDTVVLPPWAKGDPNIFIAKHRQALESPHVSKHLHQWIDLIFGHKQRGEAAIEATNVFHYLSYHGAKDLDSIEDPLERLATIGIIHNFGQTPHQIFQRGHPQREDVHPRFRRLDTAAESLIRVPSPSFAESHERVSSLVLSSKLERLLCSTPLKVNIPPDYNRYMEWGFFDGSVRFYAADSGKLIGLFEHLHQGQLSCVMFADSRMLITAGADCTISVWVVLSSSNSIDLQPKACLFGHRHPVTVLALSRSFSTLVSCSTDGRVFCWDLNRLEYVREIGSGDPVECARINDTTGEVVLCRKRHIALYTLNGDLLLEQDVCEEGDDHVVSCAFYEGTGNEWLERSLLFTGHTRGCVNIWSKVIRQGKFVLELVKRLDHADQSSERGLNVISAITCILPMPQTVYTGDEDGRVYQWDCIPRHRA